MAALAEGWIGSSEVDDCGTDQMLAPKPESELKPKQRVPSLRNRFVEKVKAHLVRVPMSNLGCFCNSVSATEFHRLAHRESATAS